MLIVRGRVKLQAEQQMQGLKLSMQHVSRSRQEPGCISHAVYVDVEDPTTLVFFEEWADQAALDAHFALAASREFMRELMAMADGEPDLRIFEASIVD